MKIACLLTLLIFFLVSRVSYAYTSPDDISDSDIAFMKNSISRGCYSRGIQQGKKPAQMEKVCSCIDMEIEQSVSKQEWAEMIFSIVQAKKATEGSKSASLKIDQAALACSQ